MRRSIDADGAGIGTATDTFFTYEGNQIVLAFDGDDDTDLTNRYLWGEMVDQILADEQLTSLSSAGDVVYPLTDHLNTTRDLATYNAGTDTTIVANHRRFDSFGNIISESNGSVTILVGFTARPVDTSSGLQWNLNRWFVAALGVWMSEDPIGYSGGDANIRRYVGNSISIHIDPTGLAEEYPRITFRYFNDELPPPGTPERTAALARRAEYEQRLRDTLNRIASRPETIAGCLALQLKNGDRALRVYFDLKLLDNAYGREQTGGTPDTIRINPGLPNLDYYPPSINDRKQTEFGMARKGKPLTSDEVAELVIVHELGHAMLGLSDPLETNPNGLNLALCDNPYRLSIGADLRTHYGKIPSIDTLINQELDKPYSERDHALLRRLKDIFEDKGMELLDQQREIWKRHAPFDRSPYTVAPR